MFFWFMHRRRYAQGARLYLVTDAGLRFAYSLPGGAVTGDMVTNTLAS